MHDIDRTQMEFESQPPDYESEEFESEESGEYGEYGETEWSGETYGETFLSEAEEVQLASELLAVTNEAELEQFLGSFIKKVGRVAGKLIRSPIGRAVGGVLKGVAKKALPLAGGAIGGYFGGPLGAKIGSGVASAAGGALGLEARMEQEDQEFEGAKQFVRLAADTVKRRALPHRGPTRARWRSRRRSRGARASRRDLIAGGQRGGMAARVAGRRALGAARQQDRALRGLIGRDAMSTVRCLDAGPGGACAADATRARQALCPARTDGAGGDPAARRTVGDRTPPGASAVANSSRRCADSSRGCAAPGAAPATAARRSAASPFSSCRFNAVLTQFDLFSDVITQRSEHETGRLAVGPRRRGRRCAGTAGRYYELPPMICYLDRGIGAGDPPRAHPACPAAARTRWRSIRVPRERMVGSGIASSLVHEVGHQAAALLDLVTSLRPCCVDCSVGGGGRPERVASCGSAGSPRSSPTSGRWRGSASPRPGTDRRGQPAARLRLPHQRQTTRIRCRGSA